MLVLGVHSGWQDAGAAVFDGYRLLAAAPLARLSGVAHDGGRLPVEAIAECLDIAQVRAGDIGGLALSQGLFPGRHFRALSLPRRVGRGLRSLLGRDTPISLLDEARKHHRSSPESLLDLGMLAGDLGLNRHIPVRVYDRHTAHALLALTAAPWADDTLVFTADSSGCVARVLKYGRLATLTGDEADTTETDSPGRLVDLAVDGLGLPDAAALFALAFAVRLAWLAFTGVNAPATFHPDSPMFLALAAGPEWWQGSPDRMPGYTLFLHLTMAPFGTDAYWAPIVVQMAIDAAAYTMDA